MHVWKYDTDYPLATLDPELVSIQLYYKPKETLSKAANSISCNKAFILYH